MSHFKLFVNYHKKTIFVIYLEIISLRLKTIGQNILSKKPYRKPEVFRIVLDNSVSLVMMSPPPINPDPRNAGSKGNNDSKPFASPFGDKPFS